MKDATTTKAAARVTAKVTVSMTEREYNAWRRRDQEPVRQS